MHFHKRDRERAEQNDGGAMYLLPQFCIFERLQGGMRESQRLKDKRKQYSALLPKESHLQCDEFAETISRGLEGLNLGMKMEIKPVQVVAFTMPPPKICVDQVRSVLAV